MAGQTGKENMTVEYYISVEAIGNGQPHESDTWEQIGWLYKIKRTALSRPYPAEWVRRYETLEEAREEVARQVFGDREDGLKSYAAKG